MPSQHRAQLRAHPGATQLLGQHVPVQEGHSGAPAPCRHIGCGARSTAWTHQAKAMAEPTARRGGYRTWAQCPCLKPEFPLRAEAELQHPRDGGSEGEACRLGSPCSCSTTSVWHGSPWRAEPGDTLPATASSTQAKGRELSWCLVTTSRECSAGELRSLCPHGTWLHLHKTS